MQEYQMRQLGNPSCVSTMLARARCLHALGEWSQLDVVTQRLWTTTGGKDREELRRRVAPMAAAGAWNRGDWARFEVVTKFMDSDDADTHMYRALLATQHGEFTRALTAVDQCRATLDGRLRALLAESYERAYRVMVKVQQLSELEEIIEYKRGLGSKTAPALSRIHTIWKSRLRCVQRDVNVWRQLLCVRKDVIRPRDDLSTWTQYSELCRQSGRLATSARVLRMLLSGMDPHALADRPLPSVLHPRVAFACVTHLWSGGHTIEALARLRELLRSPVFTFAAASSSGGAGGGVGGGGGTEGYQYADG